jgi:hypothetical protein
MKPITFTCEETLPSRPEEIAGQILDVSKWPTFQGYGPLPGIKSAEFEVRTQDVVGSRIRVTNLDGSSHTEEILEWQPERRVVMQLGNFSKPLSSMASHFIETWDFERSGNETKVVRSFEMFPRSIRAKLVLWVISFFLKGAIARHLREMKEA